MFLSIEFGARHLIYIHTHTYIQTISLGDIQIIIHVPVFDSPIYAPGTEVL